MSRIGTAPGAALVALEADLTGARLGGYQIVERIGAGGMGTVYRARGPGDATDEVAIKVLRPGLGDDRAAALTRFAREAVAQRRLDHPRVVRLLDHGEDGGTAYLVTELVRGRDLAARLAAGPMTRAEIIDVFAQVCDGVAAAHAAGIVHRDLKPANILVGSDGVKIADFGLAQLGASTAVTTLTRTDVAMGTFHYLAPEQRKDARAVDHRADVWALGVIFYEMLTGELPLGSYVPPADRRAAAIVRRALAPDPAARFATVAELGAAVRALRRPPAWRAALAALALLGVLGSGAAVAVALATGASGAGIASPADAGAIAVTTTSAPIDAAPVAPVDASVDDAAPIVADAAVADTVITGEIIAASKAPRPIKVRPPTKPTPKKPAGPPVASACRKANRCCSVVKGANCGALLTADAATCESRLAELRPRATNKKTAFVCR